MKVLIADFDLFSKVGGGQTFYRRLIETNPQIDFFYLIDRETINQKRPENAQVFPYRQEYIKADLTGFTGDIPVGSICLEDIYRIFLLAHNIAASVRQQNFNIIEIPDYEQYGVFLESALTYHQVKFDQIVLSLHGTISSVLASDWHVDRQRVEALDFLEKLQYQIVDIRYGISKDYLEKWQQTGNFPSYYLHPLHFLDLQQIKPKIEKNQKPSLNYIGRKEKGKGSDIFINLVSFIPRNLYLQANLIGPDVDTADGSSSQVYLSNMLDLRLSDISLQPAVTRVKLRQIFRDNSLIFLPSRVDTLNLIALESLFSGCPTVIGNGAGVCRFLRDNFSQVPFVELDVNNIYNSLPAILDILNNYPAYRQKLTDSCSLERAFIEQILRDELKLTDIYHQPSQSNISLRDKVPHWYQQLVNHCQQKQYFGKITLTKILKSTVKPARDWGQNYLKQSKVFLNSLQTPYRTQLLKSLSAPQQFSRTFNLPETTETQRQEKLSELRELGETLNSQGKSWQDRLKSGYLFQRISIWRAIARLEKLRGNDLVAATYMIRMMRLLGGDRFQHLPDVSRILQQRGFPREAEVLNLLYNGNPQQGQSLAYQYLESTYQKNLIYKQGNYQFIEDTRKQTNYQVSIIVSLYKAASKLNRFLQVLAHQTLLQRQQAEVILIDSGSPDSEYQIFQQLAPILNVPLVYARTENRETIQQAWNRGIGLSHSPYITCLGVDETIVPEALEILADELERDEHLDWVVGHSLVTEVDGQGNWLDDIALYNRRNFARDLVYLDTCYLTYVGGLYRRNIHTRFGFYDSSFKGAGDTEFKNRVLPHIKCKMVDRLLGIFCNYPDGRTTQSPLAEIEDLRAWYLHRSLGGIEYAFSNRNLEEAETLLLHSLTYRKSFLGDSSTDFDYALNLIDFLAQKQPLSPLLKYRQGIESLLSAYRSLEYSGEDAISPSYFPQLWNTYSLAKRIEVKHRHLAQDSPLFSSVQNLALNYSIFNDNRFQQHGNIWYD